MIGERLRRDFAERCFKQIEGFGEYGFPESHAASFALLVYASAWIKCYHPAAFACRAAQQPADGLLRAGANGARRARSRRRGARRSTSIASDWDCTLERLNDTLPPVGAVELARETSDGGNPMAR